METAGITRTSIINRLSLSLHGKLEEYTPIIGMACKQDPEFVAHLIAWDAINGQIKDSKVALPVISTATKEFPDSLVENSLAHLALMPPREMLKALQFSIKSGAAARRQRALENMIRRYLAFKEVEPGKWFRLAARHRRTLKSLYALTHAPIAEWAAKILFENQYAPGSIFADIANLKNMGPDQAAGVIQKWHLSPLVVSGAMTGSKATQESAAVVQASISQMSDTELITRTRSLEKKGLSRDAALKSTFREKVAKAAKSKAAKATLKTSVAAEEVEDDGIKTMLRELQERQIQAQKDAGRGIDGNWLVIADRSGSQEHAIELGMHVASAIAKFVSGRVWLGYCSTECVGREVTGMALEDIKLQSQFVIAAGGTSYGIGLEWATAMSVDVDGVAIVGDGGENSNPIYAAVLDAYQKRGGKTIPTYLYRTYCDPRQSVNGGDPRQFKYFMDRAGATFTEFDLSSGKVDYYSIPNLVQSMNVNRFGVVEKIMACPLLTLDQVIPRFMVAGR